MFGCPKLPGAACNSINACGVLSLISTRIRFTNLKVWFSLHTPPPPVLSRTPAAIQMQFDKCRSPPRPSIGASLDYFWRPALPVGFQLRCDRGCRERSIEQHVARMCAATCGARIKGKPGFRHSASQDARNRAYGSSGLRCRPPWHAGFTSLGASLQSDATNRCATQSTPNCCRQAPP